jgi:hypothetical protein
MTFIGKLFVMLNLGLSLAMATAAFAAYSSGIDWSDKKGAAGQPDGKLVAVKAEITELGQQLALVDQSWRAIRSELLDREQYRLATRDFYAAQLREVYTGSKDAAGRVVPAVRTVGPDRPDGGLNMVPAEEAPGVTLMSLSFYQARVKDLRDENARIRKDLEAKLAENTALTNRLTGSPDGKDKGLRRLLFEEREKNLGLVSEAGITEGMRINALVESQLVNKRLDSITQSVEQLQKYLKMKHGVDAAKK